MNQRIEKVGSDSEEAIL